MAAVTLTYDGTTLNHLEVVVPALEKAGLRATFFADPSHLLARAAAWREVAHQGHEIGNGSLLASALPDGRLPAWTPDMVEAEIRTTRHMIHELFGAQYEHSLALPAGEPRCFNDVNYAPRLAPIYRCIRTGRAGFNRPQSTHSDLVACLHVQQTPAADVLRSLELARDDGSWLVLAFGPVGESGGIDVALHQQILTWLSQHKDVVDTQPFALRAGAYRVSTGARLA
ncbi:MAG: polysaccharide deacetylase family protein [Fimbriimonadaceae bacterium]